MTKVFSNSEFDSVEIIKRDPKSWIKKISQHEIKSLYRETLHLQMEITKPEVLKCLINDNRWHKAKDILDLGCGPGYLIKILSDYFPEKTYTGVDLEESFIAFAKNLLPENHLHFIQSDVYDLNLKNPFDFIHVRALLQHLPDINRFLETLVKLTKLGSSVLFMDSAGSEVAISRFIPDIPSFRDFFLKLAKSQKEKGGNRDCLIDLEKKLQQFPFEIIRSEDLIVPNTDGVSKEHYFYYIYFVSELLDRIYQVPYDKEKFLGELILWYKAKASYAQFHGKWVHLIRK